MTSNGLAVTLRERRRMPATLPKTLHVHFNLAVTCQERRSCYPHSTEEPKVQRGSPPPGGRATGQRDSHSSMVGAIGHVQGGCCYLRARTPAGEVSP